ncbi:MAG: TonB-dependent receptor [Cyclobacteriaceae bacterium]
MKKYLETIVMISKFSLRILMLQCILTTTLFAGVGNAQNEIKSVREVEIFLDESNQSILQVLDEIESQTDFDFVYSKEDLNTDQIISLGQPNQLVASVLAEISKLEKVKFKQVNNNISIQKLNNGNAETESLEIYLDQTTISGKVLDESGEALPGASVIEQGTDNGTITDGDGNFRLTVADDAVLTVSFVGFQRMEVPVAGKSEFSFRLKEDTEQLEEVVVVGYGAVKKSDLTGSVSSVKAEELTKLGAISFDQGLAGRAPGVVVTSSSGAPGAGASVRIRAVSSLNGSDPLYVIDGIPLETSSSSGLGNQDVESSSLSPLSMINPSDIESVEILKDASSTAIYGSRGANGVVLITTKKGRSGKGKIAIDHEYGVTEIIRFVDVLESNEYYLLNREAFVNAGNTLSSADSLRLDSARMGLIPNSDWQQTIIRPGTQSNTNISFSGGSKDVTYLISGNILNSKGVVDMTDYKRISGRANLDAKVTENLKTGVTLNYTHVTSNSSSINTGVNSLRGATNPLTRATSASPTDGIPANDEENTDELWTPLISLRANSYDNLLTQFVGNIYAEYSFMEGLSFRTALSYQNRNTAQRYYQYNIIPDNVAEGGRARWGDSRDSRATVTNTINFFKTFGLHDFGVVLGQSIEESEAESIRISNYGFANDLLTYYDPGSATFQDPDNTNFSENKLASFFGRINYTLAGKYLFTLTGRYDGSSKFAANNKWAFFPAAAVAYRLSEEPFLKNTLVSNLKLRLSYGTSGNQAIGPYQSLDQYASGIQPFNEQNYTIYYAAQLPNANLSWETTTQSDLGLDFGLFDEKFSGTIDYYKKTTDNLLFTGNRIPVQSGFSTYTENGGTLETEGFEASLSAYAITRPNFTWTIRGNVSTGKTKVTALKSDNLFSGWNPGFISGGTQRLIIGEEVGAFWGLKEHGIAQFDDFEEFQGLSREEQIAMYHSDPNAIYTFVEGYSGGLPRDASRQRPGEQLYFDTNGDSTITDDDMKVIGYAQPDLILGITNTFEVRGFDFSFYIDGQFGQEIANLANFNLLNFTGGQALEVVNDRWTPENPSTVWPRLDNSNGRALMSDRIIEDGSFIRLQNVTLGYNFPDQVLERFGATGLRLYVSATNLLMLTDYLGYSPDVSVRGSNALNLGHDNGAYPLSRLVRLGVSLKF